MQQNIKVQSQKMLEKQCGHCGHTVYCIKDHIAGIENMRFIQCPACRHAVHISEQELIKLN